MAEKNAALVTLIAMALILLAAPSARAESVSVVGEDLLGGDCLQSWGTVRATVSNYEARPVRGTLRAINVLDRRPLLTRELEIPPGGTVDQVLTLPPSRCDLTLCFESEDMDCHFVATPNRQRGGQPAEVLLVQRGQSFRSILSSSSDHLQPDGSTPSQQPYSQQPSSQSLSLGLSVAELPRSQSGEALMLPTNPTAYHHLNYVVIEAALLPRLSEGQRRALSMWIRTGGELAVVADGARQILASTLLTELLPGLSAAEHGSVKTVFEPGLRHFAELSSRRLSEGSELAQMLAFDAPGLGATSYGAEASVGVGAVHLLIASTLVNSREAGGAYRSSLPVLGGLFDRPRVRSRGSTWELSPQAVYQGNDVIGYPSTHTAAPLLTVSRLGGLDANHANRPPLWLFVILVLGAALSVYLVQRRWLAKGASVLLLVAPMVAIAMAGSLSVYGLSWAARGHGARYRSAGWIEAESGEKLGVNWRQVALSFGAGGEQRIPLEGDSTLITSPTAEHRIDLDGRESLIIDGAQWQTIPATEMGVVELGGTVEIEWDGLVPVAIHNGLPQAIEDMVVSSTSQCWQVDRLEAGQRLELPAAQMRCHELFDFDLFLSQRLREAIIHNTYMDVLVAGRVDRGCEDLGSFRGERCETTLVVWGRP